MTGMSSPPSKACLACMLAVLFDTTAEAGKTRTCIPSRAARHGLGHHDTRQPAAVTAQRLQCNSGLQLQGCLPA